MIEVIKENYEKLKVFSNWGPKLAYKLSQIYPEINLLVQNSTNQEDNEKNENGERSTLDENINAGSDNLNSKPIDNSDLGSKCNEKEDYQKSETVQDTQPLETVNLSVKIAEQVESKIVNEDPSFTNNVKNFI